MTQQQERLKMKPLYEYTNEYKKVIELIENCDEITPELMDMLESVSVDAKEKIKNVASYIKNLDAHADNIYKAIANMCERAVLIEKKITSMKNYLKHNMEALQVKEIKTPEFDIKIRYNNYSLDIQDTELLPKEYLKEKVTTQIDKKQIIKDLKNDVLVPGVTFKKTSSVNIK
jgi:hypothetical protein